MGIVYREKLIEGVTIPAIINNGGDSIGGYYLISMAVYEDGTVSCWELDDKEKLRRHLESRWLVTSVPAGKNLGVHGLYSFEILEAHWKLDSAGFFQRVQEIVKQLNPEMKNIYEETERIRKKWDECRVSWVGEPTPYKIQHKIGYDLWNGEAGFLFYQKDSVCHLTPVTVYEDRSLSIDGGEKEYYTLDEMETMFSEGILSTEPPENQWVLLDGLGEVRLKAKYTVAAEEKKKELYDACEHLAGNPDSLELCRQAYYQYLEYPSEESRERLRICYEKVPEHRRMYLGDMDSKDSDYARILYHPEIKREV